MAGAFVLYVAITPPAAHRLAATHGPLHIVVIGDSVARGAGDETGNGIARDLEQELRTAGTGIASVANLGINGARTYDVQRLLRSTSVRSILRTADDVIVSIGGNDLYGDAAARIRASLWPSFEIRRVGARVGALVARIHAINPTARIILLGLYDPFRHSAAAGFLDRQVNLWDSLLIARFAADPAVTVIRIADLFGVHDRLSSLDHFHPSAAGYVLIAARIAPSL